MGTGEDGERPEANRMTIKSNAPKVSTTLGESMKRAPSAPLQNVATGELTRPVKPKSVNTMDFEVKSFEEIMKEKKRKLESATDSIIEPKQPIIKSNNGNTDTNSKHTIKEETLRPIEKSKPEPEKLPKPFPLETNIPIEDDIDRQIAEIEELINS